MGHFSELVHYGQDHKSTVEMGRSTMRTWETADHGQSRVGEGLEESASLLNGSLGVGTNTAKADKGLHYVAVMTAKTSGRKANVSSLFGDSLLTGSQFRRRPVIVLPNPGTRRSYPQ